MPPIDYFGLLAPLYDRLFRPPDVDRIGLRLGLPSDGWLLDAGGGTGRVAEVLSPLVARVVIADESLEMLARARAKPGLGAAGARTECLPFANASFARVLMADTLHHVANQERSVHEMWRVLAPEGRLVIEEPDIGQPGVHLLALFERALLMRSRFRPPEEIAAMLEALGGRATVEREGATAWVVAQKS